MIFFIGRLYEKLSDTLDQLTSQVQDIKVWIKGSHFYKHSTTGSQYFACLTIIFFIKLHIVRGPLQNKKGGVWEFRSANLGRKK